MILDQIDKHGEYGFIDFGKILFYSLTIAYLNQTKKKKTDVSTLSKEVRAICDAPDRYSICLQSVPNAESRFTQTTPLFSIIYC